MDFVKEYNPISLSIKGLSAVGKWIGENAEKAWDVIKDYNPITLLSRGIKSISDWLSKKIPEVWEFVKKYNPFSLIYRGVLAAKDWLSKKIPQIWNFIKEYNPFTLIWKGFVIAKDWLSTKIKEGWNFIKEYNPFSLLVKGFESVKNFMSEKFGNIASWFEEHNPFKPILDFFKGIGEFFQNLRLSSMVERLPIPFGKDYLIEKLREYGLAEGGVVKASNTGTLALIGEGGEDEAVLPLSKLAQIIYESFKIHDALNGTHSSALGEMPNEGGLIGFLKSFFRPDTSKEMASADQMPTLWETELLKEIKGIGKNLELMAKMMKLIKVDGIALGELVEKGSMFANPGGGVAGAAAQAAQAAQQSAGMINPASPSYGTPGIPAPAGEGGPSGNAAPFIGGNKAPGIGGRYGAIAGKRDELVLAKNQRALNAKGKHMDWSQATNNPGNVGNTDQGGTYIFPDLQSGLKAQRDLLKEKYTKNKKGEKMTLMQMCQKYTPTCWQTALPTWSKYSGIGVNEVPNLDDPNVMARLTKAIHIAEGSSSWVSPDEVDYALGLKQMPEGYQKKDYRQLTEKGRALVGKPDQSTPPPQTPGAAGTPAPAPGAAASPAIGSPTIVPASNGNPYGQTLVPQQNPTMLQETPAQADSGYAGKLLGIANRRAGEAAGYSQDRNLRITSHYDCSSFVARSLQEAGYSINPKNFSTADMDPSDKSNIMVQNRFGWTNGLGGRQPGDIMWRKGHTEIYIGNDKTIGALNTEKGVGVHPLKWGKFTGYWRPNSVSQMSPEQQAEAASKGGMQPVPATQPVHSAIPETQPVHSALPSPSAMPVQQQAPIPGMARPAMPAPGVQPMPNRNQNPAIPGMPTPAAAPVQAAQQYQYPPSKFGTGKAESLNASKQQVANLVIAEAKRQGIDPALALAIAKQESNFNQKDISRAGAVGVMQIMPADVNDYGGGNVYDINDNIRIGVTEIKKKLQLSGGDVREALLRYNWGDGNVRKWKRGARKDMPKEAREYADRVLGHIQKGTVGNILKAAGESPVQPVQSPYSPQQQAEIQANPTLQGVIPERTPQIPGLNRGGLSSVYASMTADAMARGVKYRLGARNSRTGRVDCSGWTIEMQKQIMQGVQDPAAKARLGHVLAGGTAEGIISRGLQYQGGQSVSLDPSQIKEGTMIGIKARKGGWGSNRKMGIGHIVTTFRDPNTGRMMVSESTSRGSGGRSGVITTDYEQWYKQHAGRTMWGVDTGALIGGQFDAGNVKDQMMAGGAQQQQYGVGATPDSGPQIQASQQGMVNEQASAYYAQGGGQGGYVDASTNINGGMGGGQNKPSVNMVVNKDPMGWIVLQGNAVH